MTEEKAGADIDKFLNTLSDNNILDNGIKSGSSLVRLSKEMLDKLWPSDKASDKGNGGVENS